MTLQDYIEKYKKDLSLGRDKKATLQKIYEEIKGLTYTSTGKPIESKDIIHILEQLEKKCLQESQQFFAHDNKELLDLIKTLKDKENKNGN